METVLMMNTGNGAVVHCTGGVYEAAQGEVVEMLASDADELAGHPDWLAVDPEDRSVLEGD